VNEIVDTHLLPASESSRKREAAVRASSDVLMDRVVNKLACRELVSRAMGFGAGKHASRRHRSPTKLESC